MEGWSREGEMRRLGSMECGAAQGLEQRAETRRAQRYGSGDVRSGHFIVPAQFHKRQRCTRTAADRLHACARKYQNRSKKPDDPVRE